MTESQGTLRALLASRETVLLDGAMGTELDARGLEMGGGTCLSHPGAVAEVHRSYLESGSAALTTNTLTMNRPALRAGHAVFSVHEVNLAAAALAREAAGTTVPILGDLSSTGMLLAPYGDASVEEVEGAYREQAAALLEGGVDGFILETFTDLAEALCALRACRGISALPVLVTLSFATTKGGGRTAMGNAAEESAVRLEEAGASAVGANCGDLDPREMALIVAAMRGATALPLVAQPNAGRARLVEGKARFGLGPEEFAEGLRLCAEAGARIVGGCCGTTPSHLEAAARRLGACRA